MDICPLLPVTAADVRKAITAPGRPDCAESLAQSTVRLRFSLVRAFLREVEAKGFQRNPCGEIGTVSSGEAEIRILSLEEMAAVVAAASAGAPQRKHRTLMARNRTLLLVIMECGPRAGDLANMRARDVSDGWVSLRGKTRQRWVPVDRRVTDRIKALIRGDAVWQDLDGQPLQYQGIDYIVGSALERAGIAGDRLGVHTLRHSFATNWLRQGGGVFELQWILGHRTLEMTRRYVRLAGADVQESRNRVSLIREMGLIR